MTKYNPIKRGRKIVGFTYTDENGQSWFAAGKPSRPSFMSFAVPSEEIGRQKLMEYGSGYPGDNTNTSLNNKTASPAMDKNELQGKIDRLNKIIADPKGDPKTIEIASRQRDNLLEQLNSLEKVDEPKPPATPKAAKPRKPLEYKDEVDKYEHANRLRKPGESWNTAQKKAKEVKKKHKEKAKKHVPVQREKTQVRKAKKQKPRSKLARAMSVGNLGRDARRKALLPGKRISADGNVYYESRRNRADNNRNKKGYKPGHYLEHGGPVPDNHYAYIFSEERGDFNGYVDDNQGNTVYSIDTELIRELIEDGFMRNTEDVEGLRRYLIDMEILPKGSNLTIEDSINWPPESVMEHGGETNHNSNIPKFDPDEDDWRYYVIDTLKELFGAPLNAQKYNTGTNFGSSYVYLLSGQVDNGTFLMLDDDNNVVLLNHDENAGEGNENQIMQTVMADDGDGFVQLLQHVQSEYAHASDKFAKGGSTETFKDGYVCIPDVYPALPAKISADNWNGFAIPYFDKETVDKLIEINNKLAAENEDQVTMKWVGDKVKIKDPMYDETTTVKKTGNLGWGIGAYEWTWEKCRPSKNKMARGGRLKSALNRDRGYLSGQDFEKAYANSIKPRRRKKYNR